MIQQMNHKYCKEYSTSRERLTQLLREEEAFNGKVTDYIIKVGSFLNQMIDLEGELNDAYFMKHSFDELLSLNHSYYADIAFDAYTTSFANPNHATYNFGLTVGQILSSVYEEIRQAVGFAFEHRQASLYWITELFLNVCDILVDNRTIINEFTYYEDITVSDDELNFSKLLIAELKKYAMKDMDDRVRIDMFRRFDPSFNVYNQMVKHVDLTDARYLFRYGMYIGDNEIKLFQYFNHCSIDKLTKMANTFTEAFIRGYERNNVDISSKRTINFGFHIGFEKVMRLAYQNFMPYQLEPLVYYDIKGSNRPRIMNSKPSQQMEYDHRFDDEYTLSEAWSERRLFVSKLVLDENKELISKMAGPAIIEVFGDKPFEPLSKSTCIKYDEVTKELKSKYLNQYQQLFNQYLPRSEYSFTLNSYPIPEIGEYFEAIFDETIEVNTLDEKVYMEVQQKLIEALDQGKRVHVTGRNGNRTDLTISLNRQLDVATQTNFNNCTSDVNVPLGEVFTSPRLEGTNGKLHVKEVFLHGLKYIDLEIDFFNGMMESFTCKNFDNEEENVNFVLENLTHPHKTLPLGEFAIGTNTRAYVMAKKYGIEKLIPILIGEKMGPHFAVGDTCYTWSEDVPVFNPDGREIVARDNSKTQLRKSNLEEAYTYCHTDITIPYSELDTIRVRTFEGEWLDLINKGRFVLEGTEILNEPLKELEF